MSLGPSDSTQWLEDIDAFISGEMNEQDAARFKERLRHDERARLVYVEYLDLHFELLQNAGRLASHDPAAALETRSRWKAWIAAAAVAAGLLVAASAILLSRRSEQKIAIAPEPAVEPLPGNVEVAPVELPVVARVGMVFNVSWTDSSRSVVPGTLLRTGDVLDFYAGAVEIVFDSGAKCCLAAEEGVTAFLRIDSALECAIESGQATFDVPQRARGFAVVTDGGRFVDLGTEFGVQADPRGLSQVHVLDGRVEAYGANDSRLVLDRGAAASLSGADTAPVLIPFDADAFSRPAALSRGIDAFSKGVRLHVVAPPSLHPGTVVTDDVAHLIMERRHVSLAADWANNSQNVREATSAGMKSVPSFACAAGRKVDSYLIHVTPTRAPGRREFAGTITFRRPILAVITTDDDLRTAKNLFSEPAADYPDQFGFGLEITAGKRADDRADEITLSDNRRTVSFLLNVGPVFDQFRVLVASGDEATADQDLARGNSP